MRTFLKSCSNPSMVIVKLDKFILFWSRFFALWFWKNLIKFIIFNASRLEVSTSSSSLALSPLEFWYNLNYSHNFKRGNKYFKVNMILQNLSDVTFSEMMSYCLIFHLGITESRMQNHIFQDLFSFKRGFPMFFLINNLFGCDSMDHKESPDVLIFRIMQLC